MERLDEHSLKACLASQERSQPSFDISTNPSPECGKPPFDADHVEIPVWPGSWPWTDWPLFDRSILERDMERVVRWHQARGYYDAKVVSFYVTPKEALSPGLGTPSCRVGEGCEAKIWLLVHEGEPVRVKTITVQGVERVSQDLQASIQDAIDVKLGEPFDEALYDQSKEKIQRVLQDGGYAKARVLGSVQVDPKTHQAEVNLKLDPGPMCVFGELHLYMEGDTKLRGSVVVQAAQIRRGSAYSLRALEEAQQAIYALGVFSSVYVEPIIHDESDVVEVRIRLLPGRLVRFGVGAGMMAGVMTRLEGYEAQDVRQWDVHLLGFTEFRDTFGGFQRLRIEERPRLVFREQFPVPKNPALGNVLTVQLRWPTFFEGRTNLVAGSQWDVGPDPFGRAFQRNDIDARLGPERTWRFVNAQLFGSSALHYNLFFPFDDQDFDSDPQTADVQKLDNYRVLFLEQFASLDLRDHAQAPTKGAYFSLSVHEAGYIPDVSSWTYLRWIPDARYYVPLPLGMVLAMRARFGLLHVLKADPELDELSQELGPYSYRLRGGGASSNRGFVPGYLGDGFQGGLRRWESSVEVRVPLSTDFGTVLFADAGDVIADQRFRFDRPQVSVGMGLRYQTLVGPLRLDIGYRVPGLQTFGNAALPEQPFGLSLGFVTFPGSFNLTIGEAF